MKNKNIPVSKKKEIFTALSYFPQLADTPINFKFKKRIKRSTMQAQPTWNSFFKQRKHRSYNIFISERFQISDTDFSTKDIAPDVFIGWIGHELGHIMDYEQLTRWQLLKFGIRYLLFESHIVAAERAADFFAVQQGMESYLIKTKNFILNHAEISDAYKTRIKRFYLSPEEIMLLVEEKTESTTNNTNKSL